MKELDAIKAALAALDPSVKKQWVKLDKMPYIHATDDPDAKPYSTPVVGRFDYMPSADYVLSCNPAAMQKIIAHIEEQAAEIERLRADSERYASLRRGQKWSVIDGIGNTLRAEDLDAAIDAAMKEQTP